MSDNLSPPTLHLLCDELREVVEWDIVAIHLKVDNIDIQDSRERYSGIQQCKSHCLQKWLDQTNTIHSWRTVADAVDKVNPRVADSIRTKYVTIIDHVPSTSSNTEYGSVNACKNNSITVVQKQIKRDTVVLDKDIVDKITDLEDQFAMLVSNTKISIKKRPENLSALVEYLKSRGIDEQVSLPDEAPYVTYERVFNILHTHWHYLKYRLLERIIKNFLSDTNLPDQFQRYQDDMTAFKKSTKMKDLADFIMSKQSTPCEVSVALKVEEAWLDVTLEHFELVVNLLFEEYDESLQDIVVQKSSMYVTWSVSEKIASLIVTRCGFESNVLKAIGVISIKVGTNVVFNNEYSQDYMTFDSALLRAVQSGGPFSAVSLLLEVGGNPNLLTQSGETVISIASKIKSENGDTVLIVASLYGHSSVVSKLLNNGADPNIGTNNGWTPLMVASQNGHGDVVELLLEKNVPVITQNTDGIAAIYIASRNGHSSVASSLLNNGANPNIASNNGWTSLMVASENGHGDVVELLLEKNVPVDIQLTNGMTAIYIASYNGHSSVVSTLLNNGADPNIAENNGWTPLMIASKNGHSKVVEILLEKNVPVNTQLTNRMTAIYIACQNGHSSVVSTLLNIGADSNIGTNNGWTPLMIASENGHGDVVELLLKKNVPVNTQNTNGSTAIYIASQNGHSSVVSTLLNKGADPNIATNDGWTPLMIAGQNGHGHVVELLLEKNVPVNAIDKNGVTVIYIASQNGHSSIVSTLLNNGANPNLARDNGWTPLIIACVKGHDNIVKELLKTQINVNHQTRAGATALHLSSRYGFENITTQLLEYGANPLMSGLTPLNKAHHHKIVSILQGYATHRLAICIIVILIIIIAVCIYNSKFEMFYII